MRICTITIAIALVFAGRASAEGRSQVFPLANGGLPANRARVTQILTNALAKAIGADVATVPIEDAAGLLDCDVESSACLASVSKSIGARRLVFGTVRPGAGTTIVVTLTRFDVGPDRQQRTFEITGATDDALGAELVRASASLFEPAGAAPPPPALTPTPSAPTPPVESDPPTDTPSGGVRTSTWLLLGAGLVASGAGAGLFVSSRSIQADVDSAPMNTAEDFRRLVELEDKGQFRSRLGQGLMIGGGVVLAVFAWRLIVDRGRTREPKAAGIGVAPIAGGVAFTFTLEVP